MRKEYRLYGLLLILTAFPYSCASKARFDSNTQQELQSPQDTTIPQQSGTNPSVQIAKPLAKPTDGQPKDAESSQTLVKAGSGETPNTKPTEEYPIDLLTALRLAGANNLQIAFVKEKVKEAQAEEEHAAAQYLPTLVFNPSYMKHEGRIQATEGDILQISKVSGFVGGGFELTVDFADAVFETLAARQVVKAREWEQKRTIQETLLIAASQYYDLVKAKALVEIERAAVVHSEELLRNATNLEARGAGLKTEIARAKAHLASDQQSLFRAEEAFRIASVELATTLRLDQNLQLLPVEKEIKAITLVDKRQPLSELINEALNNRPELKESYAMREAAEKFRDLAKWGPLIPTLGASASAGGFGGGTGSTFSRFSDRQDYSIFLKWEFENLGFGDRARIKREQAKLNQVQLTTLQIRDEIIKEVIQAKENVETAAKQIEVSEQGVLAAVKSLELNQSRFRGGVGIALEVLQAQESLTQAESNHLIAIIEYNKAQHRLLRSLGRLLYKQQWSNAPDTTSEVKESKDYH